jgi:hypothetical protein
MAALLVEGLNKKVVVTENGRRRRRGDAGSPPQSAGC